MDQSARFARHLAFGLGAVETFAGVALAAMAFVIGQAVSEPDPIGRAIVIGFSVFAICFPALLTVLAMAHRKQWVVYSCSAALALYPVAAIAWYSTNG